MYKQNRHKDIKSAIESYSHYIKHFESNPDQYNWDDIEIILFVRQAVHDLKGDHNRDVIVLDDQLKALHETISAVAEIEPDYPQELIDQGIIDEKDRENWWWHLVG